MSLSIFPFSADPVQKDEINKKAFEKFRKEHTSVAPTVDNAVPSERFDGECCDVCGAISRETCKMFTNKRFYISAAATDINAAAWTSEEQKLLEQALKTYPVSTPERWEKIAAAVPGRSKKDCMKRYKVRERAARGAFCFY